MPLRYLMFPIFFMVLATYIAVSNVFLPKRTVSTDVSDAVLLPLPVELVLTAGDPYLLANLTSMRTTVFPLLFTEGDILLRGAFHRRVSDLNARHEDNVYIVNAALPWEGDVDSAQYVLRNAKKTRAWDAMPFFMYGLNALYFNGDVVTGTQNILQAAEIEQGVNKQYFQRLGNKLSNSTSHKRLALAYLNVISNYVSNPVSKYSMSVRTKDLKNQIQLESAAQEYFRQFNRWPESQAVLIELSLIDNILVSPYEKKYVFNDNGLVELK